MSYIRFGKIKSWSMSTSARSTVKSRAILSLQSIGQMGLYGKRIRYRRATKKRDEVAPFHYSARPMLADAI